MSREALYVLGIDLGTQGVRCMITSLAGEVIAEERDALNSSHREETRFEQDPGEWIATIHQCVRKTVYRFLQLGYPREALLALACDSTSGTVVPVDGTGKAIGPAIMYNDARAQEEASLINSVATEFCQKMGYCFDPSFALCKVLWLKRNNPHLFAQVRYFLHAADYVVGHLTGEWGTSDISNSLKMGYDLLDLQWPDFIEKDLHIPLALLPQVYKTGEVIGTLRRSIAEEWQCLPLQVVAGATDGTASFYASGANAPGDVSSTLGTTLVIRSIAEKQVKDPQGRIYCHLHPEGFWLPGGASNTGGECLNHFFPQANFVKWDERVKNLSLPTPLIVYPLVRQGERLPFAHPKAQFFKLGVEKEPLEFYAACLEGVGYVERYSFDLLESLGASPIQRVFASGSGSKSLTWCQIRADILKRPIKLPATLESAMGSCVIAAVPQWGSLSRASTHMVQIVATIDPDPRKSEHYEERYMLFLKECEKRGYT